MRFCSLINCYTSDLRLSLELEYSTFIPKFPRAGMLHIYTEPISRRHVTADWSRVHELYLLGSEDEGLLEVDSVAVFWLNCISDISGISYLLATATFTGIQRLWLASATLTGIKDFYWHQRLLLASATLTGSSDFYWH